MRVNVVFRALYFLCVLATADAASCDKSLINSPDEFVFDSNSKTLSCPSDETTLETKLVFNSERYDSLTCDDKEGWKSGRVKVADASSPLNITCVEYCAIVRATSNAGKISETFHGPNKQVGCESGLFGLIYNSQVLDNPHHIYCNKNKWYYYYTEVYTITNDTATPQHFECAQKCTRFQLSNDVQRKVLDHKMRTVFTCNNIGKNGGIRINDSAIFSEIECQHNDKDHLNGYVADGRKVAGPWDMVHLSCTERCGISLINAPEELVFNNETNTISCPRREKSLTAIVINSERFVHILCSDLLGWRGYAGRLGTRYGDRLADPSSPLNATCKEYCSLMYDTNVAVFKHDERAIQVKCIHHSYGLLYNTSVFVESATCDFRGWRSKGKLITDDITTPQDFWCVPGCVNDIAGDGVKRIVINNLTQDLVFKCTLGDNYGIRLNKGSLFENITCDFMDGYMADGIKLAGPYDEVRITCGFEDSTTTSTTTASTSTAIRPSRFTTEEEGTTTTSKTPIEQAAVANTSMPLVIGGSIVGVLILLAIVGAVIFVVMRRSRKNAKQANNKVQTEGLNNKQSNNGSEQLSKSTHNEATSENSKKDSKRNSKVSKVEGLFGKSKTDSESSRKSTRNEGSFKR